MLVGVVVELIKKGKKSPLRGWPSSWLPLCDAKVVGVAMVAVDIDIDADSSLKANKQNKNLGVVADVVIVRCYDIWMVVTVSCSIRLVYL